VRRAWARLSVGLVGSGAEATVWRARRSTLVSCGGDADSADAVGRGAVGAWFLKRDPQRLRRGERLAFGG